MEEQNRYLETLTAIETFSKYLQEKTSFENYSFNKSMENLEYYLDHPEEFTDGEQRDIDRGLAKVVVRYMIAKTLKKE